MCNSKLLIKILLSLILQCKFIISYKPPILLQLLASISHNDEICHEAVKCILQWNNISNEQKDVSDVTILRFVNVKFLFHISANLGEFSPLN